jgi:hypothetical protein
VLSGVFLCSLCLAIVAAYKALILYPTSKPSNKPSWRLNESTYYRNVKILSFDLFSKVLSKKKGHFGVTREFALAKKPGLWFHNQPVSDLITSFERTSHVH